MATNQIIFTINNDTGTMKVKMTKPIEVSEFMQFVMTACMSAMSQTVERCKDEQEKTQAKEDLYDMFNYAASAVLQKFAPEIEARPDLTTQAILEAENKIIQSGRAPKLLS